MFFMAVSIHEKNSIYASSLFVPIRRVIFVEDSNKTLVFAI